MRRLLILIVTAGAFGVIAVDATPSLAAKCHCQRVPRGFTGAHGPQGPAGPPVVCWTSDRASLVPASGPNLVRHAVQ